MKLSLNCVKMKSVNITEIHAKEKHMKRVNRILTAVLAALTLTSGAVIGAGAAEKQNCGGRTVAIVCSGRSCGGGNVASLFCGGNNCGSLPSATCNGNDCSNLTSLLEQFGCKDNCGFQGWLHQIGQTQLTQPVQPAEPATVPVTEPTEATSVPPATQAPTEAVTIPPATQVPTEAAATKADESGYIAAYEDEVLRLVNVERANYGLAPLTRHEGAAQAARVRAKEIVQSFSHTRPDGRSCFTAGSDIGVTYRTAGENIAYGYPSPEAVVRGWMNSEGHRKNILSGAYTQLGVGCYQSSRTLYWSQFFIG